MSNTNSLKNDQKGGVMPFNATVNTPPAGIRYPGRLLPGSPPIAAVSPLPGAMDKISRNLPNMPSLPYPARLRGINPGGMMSGLDGRQLLPNRGADIGMAVSYPNSGTYYHNTAIDRVTGVANTPGNNVTDINRRLTEMTGPATLPKRTPISNPNIPVITQSSAESEKKKEESETSATSEMKQTIDGAGVIVLEKYNNEAVVLLYRDNTGTFNDFGQIKSGEPVSIAREAVKNQTNDVINLDMCNLEEKINDKDMLIDLEYDDKKYKSYIIAVPQQNITSMMNNTMMNMYNAGKMMTKRDYNIRKFKINDLLSLNDEGEEIKMGDEKFKIGKRVIRLLKEAKKNNLIDTALSKPLKYSSGPVKSSPFGVPGTMNPQGVGRFQMPGMINRGFSPYPRYN